MLFVAFLDSGALLPWLLWLCLFFRFLLDFFLYRFCFWFRCILYGRHFLCFRISLLLGFLISLLALSCWCILFCRFFSWLFFCWFSLHGSLLCWCWLLVFSWLLLLRSATLLSFWLFRCIFSIESCLVIKNGVY